MHNTRIRIVCVDDHSIVRDGVALIINRQHDMRVVGSAATGEEAIALYDKERPDIVLMDLRLRTMSGLEAIKAIHSKDEQARIIVLTMYDGDEHIYRALAAGATAYLLKDTLADDLVRVVREVHAGLKPVEEDVQAKLAERESHPVLSPREMEVIQFLVEGKRNKEIAQSLAISQETVQVHLKNIYAKLHVSDRTAALSVALRRGMVKLD
jgi:two-component system, NarL family, response regulator